MHRPRTSEQLRRDALAIWRAGCDAVLGDRLVRENVTVDGKWLCIAEEPFPLDQIRRIVAVGAGKASAAMAAGLETALGPELLARFDLTGWVNVPADCLEPPRQDPTRLSPPDLPPPPQPWEPPRRIRLHPARPAGKNEPTHEGIAGAREIIRLVRSLGEGDLCLCLLSGGGSALLPLPREGVPFEEKLLLTQRLSSAGANIREMNVVRKQLSEIKGGGLARACRGSWLRTLVISDVMGDDLSIIASGPTVRDSSTAAEALAILERFSLAGDDVAPHAAALLRRLVRNPSLPRDDSTAAIDGASGGFRCSVENRVIGNNAVAVRSAASVSSMPSAAL